MMATSGVEDKQRKTRNVTRQGKCKVRATQNVFYEHNKGYLSQSKGALPNMVDINHM